MINASRPINQLPPEVMALIFSLVPDDLVSTKNGPIWRRFSSYRTMNARELCPLTAVCRQWRDVALSTSSLWSCTYDWTRIVARALHDNYIHRCKGGPLYICIDGCMSDTTQALLFNHGERVRELHIDAISCRRSTEIKKLYALVHASRLENIEQCTLGHMTGQPVLSELLGGTCTKLRKLRLDTVSMFPSSPISSLTHLAILSPARLPNLLGGLLAFLDSCPALQELYLYDFAFSSLVPSVGDWRGGPVRLNNLERFLLREMLHRDTLPPRRLDHVINYISSILPFLAIPASCVVRVSDVLASWLQPCLQSLAGDTRESATHMYIRAIQSMDKRNIFTVRAVNVARRQYTSVDVGVFRSWQSGPQQELLQPLRVALAQLPLLSRIRELYIHSGEGVAWGMAWGMAWGSPPQQWDWIFPALPPLETLVVELHHPTCARQFLVALEVPTSTDPSAPPEVFCPRLTTIVLSQSSSNKDATFMRSLAKARADAGYPLARLLLEIRRKDSSGTSEYNAHGELVRFLTQEEADDY
ncbi:hypothetical protein C8T65DRAFT_274337 [Cerioporus squamosus]|nr:hypothetical protein C8T65DRAFT_274337 [Cerioporus squamosus]